MALARTESTATARALRATTARQMLNKVPEVTVYFWVIKVLCTTVGETAADFLDGTVGLGLTNTTYVMSACSSSRSSGSSDCALTCPSPTGWPWC